MSAAEKLARKWQIRKNEALKAVSIAVREDRLSGADAAQLAKLVHNVAGTAGLFGEGDLGILAGALERALRNGEAALSSDLAHDFLRAA